MNRKQIISMWLGIVAFVFVGIVRLNNMGYSDISTTIISLIVMWICISVVAAGLIYTFRDKIPKSK